MKRGKARVGDTLYPGLWYVVRIGDRELDVARLRAERDAWRELAEAHESVHELDQYDDRHDEAWMRVYRAQKALDALGVEP
jgi:hypothetical protein